MEIKGLAMLLIACVAIIGIRETLGPTIDREFGNVSYSLIFIDNWNAQESSLGS